MPYVFDPDKSAKNLEKHGISLADAVALFADGRAVTVPAKTVLDEERFKTIGVVNGKIWALIWIKRGEAIRGISCRRARKQEAAYYEKDQD